MNNNNDQKMCMCQEVIEYKINGLHWCGIKLFRRCTYNEKVMGGGGKMRDKSSSNNNNNQLTNKKQKRTKQEDTVRKGE